MAAKAAALVAPVQQVTVTMTKDKETKNTVRYTADIDGGPLTVIYIGKDLAGAEEHLTVTIATS